jgi:N-acetyl sugar amidotransferase
MNKFKYPSRVSFKAENYSANLKNDELVAKFGLPSEVRFCKICTISNQRPNSALEYAHNAKTIKKTINVDEDGMCDSCRHSDNKNNKINWDERHRELTELCNQHRSKDGSYDCIIPGSGGKDSFYASHVLKYKYGMNPLTVTWSPHMYTPWGWNNFQKWIDAGFDNYLCTPNGKTHQLLTRLAVENLFHPFQPFIFGQKFFAPKIAMLHNIKLVFYGENEAEYGNPLADNASSKRAYEYFSSSESSDIFLGGTSISELKSEFGLNDNDLYQYMPCNPNELSEKGVEVHYTGYYMKWHPQQNYYYAVEHMDFETSPERMPGTYSKYVSVDDKMEDFNYYTQGIKYGLGWSSYVSAHEIRSGDLTREEGAALVKKYDLEFPERYIDDFLKYISIDPKSNPEAAKNFEQPIADKDYFMSLHDRFRSPHLWIYENGSWRLRHTVWDANNSPNFSSLHGSDWKGNKR